MTEAETDYIYEELVKIEHLIQDLSLHLYDKKKEKNNKLLAYVDHDKVIRINKILHEAEFKLVDCMKINAEGLKQNA
tara:strand:+ start:594 stop:824 length:231 start_codon:yes stop_codon:yes gene_type:complete